MPFNVKELGPHGTMAGFTDIKADYLVCTSCTHVKSLTKKQKSAIIDFC